MRQFVMIYTGLLLVGLSAMVLYGLLVVTVTDLVTDDIHFAGVLSVENGFDASRRIDGPADRFGWDRRAPGKSRVERQRIEARPELPCKIEFGTAPCDSI